METTTIGSLMETVGAVFTAVSSWVTDVAEIIVANPILLLFVVGVPLCGIAIGMFNRLVRSGN